jgi:hypothetical protein
MQDVPGLITIIPSQKLYIRAEAAESSIGLLYLNLHSSMSKKERSIAVQEYLHELRLDDL